MTAEQLQKLREAQAKLRDEDPEKYDYLYDKFKYEEQYYKNTKE